MYLRKLKLQDAPLMLEWMHDDDVTHDLSGNFAEKSLEDCEKFIRASADATENMHLAIASDSDEYMGTVSLKHINEADSNAEFAITVRKEAMGKGYAWFGMSEIIRIAFEELGLKSVYWCVSKENKRACRFYDKHGFREALDISDEIIKRYAGVPNLKWYAVTEAERNNSLYEIKVDGCKVIEIKTITSKDSGKLSFFEAKRDMPFEIKRVYYISGVKKGIKRGFHAHKELKQLIFCPYGEIELLLDDGSKKDRVLLNDPSTGILIEKPVWREMLWKTDNSVLCVAASDYYDENDYLRDYEDFIRYIERRDF